MHSAERYGLQVALTLCFASSEDESYPAEALRSQTKLSCGWQSAKHCGYPQELGFRFNGQVSLEFVRILAHESKISSLIDIYVANATNEEIQTGICAAYETAEFVRLGHVRFSPNEESNCQARELKTVGVHRPCMYLKLILRNPHHSTYNMFQQVGLVGITAHGQLMHNFSTWAKSGVAIAVGEFMDTPLDEMTPFRTGVATSMIVMDKDNNPVVTDAATSRRLSELNRLKARAVAEEDYDLANAIKQQISAATTALNQILELEQEKLKAVENEDFAKAKDLKRQIDALRNSGYQRSTAILAAPPHGGYSSGGVSSMPPVDEQSATAKGVKDEKTGGIVITEKEDPNARQLSPTENAEPWERKLNEIIVMNCAGQEPPVALEGEIAAEGNLYEKDLGIYCVGCLFSRRGRLREAAIRSVVSDEGMRILSVHTDSALASMVTYMASQGHGITDPAAAAVLTTCEAMERIISDELSGSTAIVQGSASFAQLVSQLVARVGDSNNRIREAVEKAVVAVARSVFGTDRIVAELIGDAKKMIKRSVCFHLSRFHILTTFVNDFGIDPSENDNALEVETLLTQVVLPCLEHSTKSVREAAAKLFAKLMILNTDICQPLLSGLKPTLQALIQQQAEELRKKEPTVSGPEMDVDTFSVRDFNSELTTPMHRGRKAKRSTPSSQRRPSLQSGGRTPRQTPRRPKLPEKLLHDEGSERSSRITPRGARKSSLVSLRSPYRPGTESARGSPSRRPPPVAPLDPQIGKDEYEDFQSGAFAGPPPSDHGRDTTPPPTGRSPRRGMISPEEKTTEEFEDEVRELAEMLRQTPRHPHSRQSRRSHSDSSHTPKAESATSGGESSRRQRANSIPIGTCQFCGVTDPNFNEETLDVHFVRFCPMLCPCPLCDQVTEISTLQQHLVSECEGRGLVRECPRCHEAIRAEEIKRHVAANTCIATADDSEMCPLCHACFKSGLSEWRKHLAASPGCPNNPRKWDGSGPLMIM